MPARDRTGRARGVLQKHLAIGEFLRTACVCGLRDPVEGFAPVNRAEGFVGLVLGGRGAAVLTSTRLVYLPVRARDRDGTAWYRAQFALPGLRVTGLETVGFSRVLTLRTGVGERRLVARQGDAAALDHLAAELGWRPPTR